MSVEYDRYLAQHIENVEKGYEWLKEKLPEIFKGEFTEGIVLHHDASKTDRREYEAYDAYFYGPNKSYKVVQEFRYAWLRHIHMNPHHWQYWVLINDDPDESVTCLEMPKRYIIEMICDWWSFSWAKDDLMEIFNWWSEHAAYIMLNPKTRKTVIDILGKMKNELEKEFTLEHHGVKGQRWGVRRTPEQLAAAKGLASDENSDTIRNTLYGHVPTPKKSTPNSITDHVDYDGKVDKRIYYGSDGMKEREIHTTNHGHPKQHTFGQHGEHVHEYGWDSEGNRTKYVSRELTDDERKENDDIL